MSWVYRNEALFLTIWKLDCAGKTLGKPCPASVELEISDRELTARETWFPHLDAQLARLCHLGGKGGTARRLAGTAWQFDDMTDSFIGSTGMVARNDSLLTARCPLHQIQWPNEPVSPWTLAFEDCVSDVSLTLLEMEQRLGLSHSPLGKRYDKLIAQHGGVDEYNGAVESNWSERHA